MNDRQFWNIDIILPDGTFSYLEWNTSLSASEICKHFEKKEVVILKLERAAYAINKFTFIKPKELTKGATI